MQTLTLILLTLFARAFVFSLATLCASWLPSFDSSAGKDVFTRWDVVHFAHIAQSGYTFEYEWAFLPGVPMLLRYLPTPIFHLLSVAVDVGSTISLYDLSLEVLKEERIAALATLLSLLPSSPATLRLAPYNEPFFAFLSYRGMLPSQLFGPYSQSTGILHCQRKQYLAATAYFTLAGLFRSNSILLGGFLLWGMLVAPFLSGKSIELSAPLYVAPIFLPFLGHNAAAYLSFCTSDNAPQWCTHTIPLIYSHAQKTYWGVGFLSYFTLAQLPNFIIAAPPILLIYGFAISHIRQSSTRPFRSRTLTPHVIHAVVLTTTLVFSAHTQIVLRLASSMPVTYWAAAWLVMYHPKLGYAWVAWSIVWGTISIVLWATFLPPA